MGRLDIISQIMGRSVEERIWSVAAMILKIELKDEFGETKGHLLMTIHESYSVQMILKLLEPGLKSLLEKK